VVFNPAFFGIVGVAKIGVLKDVLRSFMAVDLSENKTQQFVLVSGNDMLLEGRRHALEGVYFKFEWMADYLKHRLNSTFSKMANLRVTQAHSGTIASDVLKPRYVLGCEKQATQHVDNSP
jgi:hypothetical protein